MMAKLKAYWPFLAFTLLVLVWTGFAVRSCSARHQAAQQEAQADQHHEQAIQQAAQGGVHDQVAQAQADKATQDALAVARLRAELARLRARPVQPPPTPGAPDPVDVAPPPDPVLAQADALIAAQDQQIQDQAAEIHTLTLARDSWKAAYEDEAKAAAAQRIAMEAQAAAIRSSRWQGRIEGFLVGVGAGYVGGKL
jgi:small-conductance mechanosensitive channel